MWCGAARSVAPSCTTCATGAANPPASPSGPNGRRKPPKPRSNPRVPLALQGDPEEFADISGRHTTPEQGDCGCVESVAFLTAARLDQAGNGGLTFDPTNWLAEIRARLALLQTFDVRCSPLRTCTLEPWR